ncbi:hypothetical protein KJ766_02120 [Patescibacteria group bacterium]|nr:hypothetical protein [Patescibacteria group bacterium]
MKPFLMVLLFFCSALVSTSFIQALSLPFALLPLHLIVGTIILHREGFMYGGFWFIASAVTLPILGSTMYFWWIWLLIGFFGIFLVQKVITNRSVYALVGLGIVLHFATRIICAISLQVVKFFNLKADVVNVTIKEEVFIFLAVICALYISFNIARFIENTGSQLFMTKN